jgi:hypothetical protein
MKSELLNVGSNIQNEVTQKLDEKNIKRLFSEGVGAQAVSGFTYRHDWGNRKGQWKLNLSHGGITNQSRVYVSICEFGGGSNQGFIGAAKYTVHNVACYDGGVNVWVNIEWGNDIRLRADYLVVN